ncbi:MAG: DsbE family thiol:disulfide interchange protein [Gammaproteobacteria bacterium]|nr:DsbE family thiol:disulfide interchange protein [Gammaproteobacteria bacterium]
MKRFIWPLVAFALLVVVLAIGLRHAPEKGVIRSPLIGRPAPQYELPDLRDPTRMLRSAELLGQWHLVNVWATWCSECRVEHRQLLAIRDDGRVPIIGIDWKDDDEQARRWLASLGDPYQQVGTDHSGDVAINWGVYGAPETFLVDPRGVVVAKQIGAMTAQTWQEWLRVYVSGSNAPGKAGAP